MNQMERLQNDLSKRFPEHISATIDAPETGKGSWFLDLRREGEGSPFLVVEWRPDRGFGVSTPREDDFGVGPDEVYPNRDAAFDRIVRLVESGGETEPPGAVRFPDGTVRELKF